MAELPGKIKQDLLAELEAKETAKQQVETEADTYIQTQVSALKESGQEFDEKELLNFAIRYEITDLGRAFELYQEVNKAKSEGEKTGEKIALRKAASGVKSSKTSSEESKFNYRPGQSLDDIIAEAKANLRT